VGAGAGDVCAGEALEDSVERVFGDAAAFVCHFDHDADSRGFQESDSWPGVVRFQAEPEF
jgi:hypothetical protein